MNTLSFRGGWIPDLPDQRDIRFSAIYSVPALLPPKVDLRKECSEVENQGSLGSCTGQSLIGALEFLERKHSKTYTELSRLFVYYNERLIEDTVEEDCGAMLRTGIKVLKNFGICREILWPYDISRFRDKPNEDCYAEGLEHQITGYQRLTSLHEMKGCLAIGLPFVFGFSVYEGAMSEVTRKSGDIMLPNSNERMLGGHAILAVGYDDDIHRVIFRNSWGVEWGKEGYGTIPYEYLEERNLSDDFWCIQATESNGYV